MRLFRRNALGVYAVYGATMVSGLVVTPIVLHELGKETFGVWSFIGSIAIYLAVLDLGVGPSVVRFAAEARGRDAPEETNELASVALALYAAIGTVTLVASVALSWLVPVLIDVPDGLVGDARLATFLVAVGFAARFPLGLFYNLLGGHQRVDVQNLGNFIGTVLYAVLVAVLIPRGGGLVLLGAVTLGVTLFRLGLPLFWLRSEFPQLRLRRAYVTRARVRALASVSWSNFLVHVANKVVFSTDIVVVGIVLGPGEAAIYAIASRLFQLAFGLASVLTSLLYPAFAEYEGAGAEERQRRLLLAGLRGGSAAALVLALPLLVIPEQLVTGWLGEGYDESAPVLALLALVLLAHQPIWLLTQYLIARGRQQQIARLLVTAAAVNVVLSIVLAATVGTWGVALATLLTDVAVLALAVPRATDAAGLRIAWVVRALVRPAVPAVAVAVVVFGIARALDTATLLELLPVGIAWCLLAALGVWTVGLTGDERRAFARQLRGVPDQPDLSASP
ncbi:MAG: oligosaccharide flippase family protein [Gaiellaceae bacterium]